MSLLISRINLPYFITAFAIGLLFCYVSTPPPQVVVKFPSPHNAGKVVYKDKSDTCYMYHTDRSTCPKEASKVREQPISEGFRGVSGVRGQHLTKRGEA
jgi:anaerobic selenocysteine-containing dehydrogenase